MTRRWWRIDERGASLLEMLLAILLLPVVLLLVFTTYVSGVVVLGNSSRDWQAQGFARSSVQVMARGLRQAVEVAAADANQIGFYADLDKNGVEEAIVYRLVAAADRIERGVNRTDLNGDGRADGMPTTFGVFLPSVLNPAGTFLTYYDGSGAQITGGAGWPSTIRAIGFEVHVDVKTTDQQPPGRYRTVVGLRTVGFRSW